MVTMEIGILMESTETGIFLDYGVQLSEDLPRVGSSRHPEANRRHSMLWACEEVPRCASGAC